jgi:hypothetical protein
VRTEASGREVARKNRRRPLNRRAVGRKEGKDGARSERKEGGKAGTEARCQKARGSEWRQAGKKVVWKGGWHEGKEGRKEATKAWKRRREGGKDGKKAWKRRRRGREGRKEGRHEGVEATTGGREGRMERRHGSDDGREGMMAGRCGSDDDGGGKEGPKAWKR